VLLYGKEEADMEKVVPRYIVGLVRNRVNQLCIERSTTRIARVVNGFDSHLRYHIKTHYAKRGSGYLKSGSL